MDDNSLAIGVDLGATKIATALLARSGRVLRVRQAPTQAAEGANACCQRIADEIRALLAEQSGDVVGIGIGSPGVVDSERGIIRDAINLAWGEFEIAKELSHRVGDLPVFLENDANVNAVGEAMFGSARGSDNVVLLTVGSGLGCGIISEGRLITGGVGIAADLGHYSIDPDGGRLCVCGNHGCAETVVSGQGLIANARELLADGPSQLRNDGTLTSDAIVTAARNRDPIATAAVDLMARWLGQAAAVATAVVNSDVVVIGGGLGTAAFDFMKDQVTHQMHRRLPPSYRGRADLRRATLLSPAAGAASLVWSRLGNGKA